jgi:hypothetical protein
MVARDGIEPPTPAFQGWHALLVITVSMEPRRAVVAVPDTRN